jgi:hypothetical protein
MMDIEHPSLAIKALDDEIEPEILLIMERKNHSMKKRTKLMLGISALLAASAGVAATGTFAWFTATAASITYQADTGTIGAIASDSQIGSFKITVSDITVSPATIALTEDGTGDTYVMVGGVKTPATATDKVATISSKITVTYVDTNETNPSDAEVKTLWADALGSNNVIVTASATAGTNASQIRFTSGASNYTGAAANAKVSIASATAKAWDFSSKTTGKKDMPNIYVALTGKETAENLASYGSITLTLTPSVGA